MPLDHLKTLATGLVTEIDAEAARIDADRAGWEQSLKACSEHNTALTDANTTLQADLDAARRRIAELEAAHPTPTDPTVKVDIWVAPTATGDGSGSSPENLKAYSALPGLCAPGRHIGLMADRVWPALAQTFSKGGADGAPCVIQGVGADRKPQQVTIRSTRPKPNETYDPEWPRGAMAGGHDLFNLTAGADFISFRNILAENCGEVFRVNRTIRGLDWQTVHFINVKEMLWMDNDPEPDGMQRGIHGFTARDIYGFGCEMGLRLYGSTRDVLIEGVEIDSRRSMGNISIMFQIGKGDATRIDTVHNVKIVGQAHGRSGICRNVHDQHYDKPWKDAAGGLYYAPAASDGYRAIDQTKMPLVKNPEQWPSATNPGTHYWNGDVVSAERNCYDLHFEKLVGIGCTDSVFDVKAKNAVFVDCGGEDTKRTFRLWGSNAEHKLVGGFSRNPRKRGGSGGSAHIFVTGADVATGGGPKVHVDGMEFVGGPANVFHINKEQPYGVVITHANLVLNGKSAIPLKVG